VNLIRGFLVDFCTEYHRIFSENPKGFRAVMHTIDNTQLRLLEKYNFAYDSSVIPRYVPFRKYVGYKGKAPSVPYNPSYTNYREKGEHKILEIPNSPLIFGIPLSGTWIRVLTPRLYITLYRLKKPDFISLSMHSWDAAEYKGSFSKNSGDTFLNYLETILRTLSHHYRFMPMEQILSMKDK